MDFFTISGPEMALRTGRHRRPRRRRPRAAAGGGAELLQPAVTRARRLVRAPRGGGRFEQGWWPPAVAERPAGGARRAAGLGARPRLRRRRSGCVSVLQAWSTSSPRSRGRRSSRFARTGSIRRRSWSACARRTSTCGSSPVAVSCVRRSGTGRATTTSTGWWPGCDPRLPEGGHRTAASAARSDVHEPASRRFAGPARRRSAAARRPRSRCGRRARARGAPRRRRPRRDAPRRRTTAA